MNTHDLISDNFPKLSTEHKVQPCCCWPYCYYQLCLKSNLKCSHFTTTHHNNNTLNYYLRGVCRPIGDQTDSKLRFCCCFFLINVTKLTMECNTIATTNRVPDCTDCNGWHGSCGRLFSGTFRWHLHGLTSAPVLWSLSSHCRTKTHICGENTELLFRQDIQHHNYILHSSLFYQCRVTHTICLVQWVAPV